MATKLNPYLNFRDNAREAQIIARAGEASRVTVATALAGRGTDIRLSDAARQAGGLYVIGFGHQNTRRGDRQLMGRSGRQGDPGVSRFFEEDENPKKRKPLTRRTCLRAIRGAQGVCEGAARAQRETTLKLDEVIGRFRAEIYGARNRILAGEMPPQFTHLPAPMVQAVALSAIDEAWAAFLREADDARQRCGVVSLVGKDYQREYIREVAAMFEAMTDGIEETMQRRLARASEGVVYVDPV